MKEIKELFKNSRIKSTTARIAIIKQFFEANSPVCYEDIKDKLEMDKATFYRNVAKFEEYAVLNSFESNDKKRYYEIAKTLHAHFVCSNCSTITCLEQKLFELKGHKVENIIIKGLCPSCI